AQNINEAQGDLALKAERVDKLFELAWPELEQRIASIPPVPSSEKHDATTDEMVREILARIRADQREAEAGESDYSKTRDSLLTLMLNLFEAGTKSTNALPSPLAKDFDDWTSNVRAFLSKKDF